MTAVDPCHAQKDRLLLVEDDHAIGAVLVEGLQREGFELTWARDGEDGYAQLATKKPRVLILDWMLPKQDGVKLLQRARQAGIGCPTLFLTARDQVSDRVAGLEAGADDYLCKPFAFAELLARVRALLRRQTAARELWCANLRLDTVSHVASRAGKPIDLTAREYALLEFLMRNKTETITRDMLARDVWKVTQRATPIYNVIDVHIARLRRKLEADDPSRLLHTMRGIGFCLSEKEPW